MRAALRVTAALGVTLAFTAAAAAAPLHALRCPHHQAAHGIEAGEGAAGHDSPAHAADAGDQASESGDHSGPCRCLGACRGAGAEVLAAPSVRPVEPPQVAPAHGAPRVDSPRPVRPAFFLPYAQAPPRA